MGDHSVGMEQWSAERNHGLCTGKTVHFLQICIHYGTEDTIRFMTQFLDINSRKYHSFVAVLAVSLKYNNNIKQDAL